MSKSDEKADEKKSEASRLRAKYPGRLPVIVEKAAKSDLPDVDKNKYLVPVDMTVSQFLFVVRKRIKCNESQALFVFVKNTLPPMGALVSSIYEQHQDEDGFLYVTYSGENTFGSD